MPARPLRSLIPGLRHFALPALLLSTLLPGCSGGSSGMPAASYTVGGTVSGLSGAGLVLTDNGGNALSVPANATAFTFSTAVQSGNPFNVAVMTQPGNPSQSCVVANAAGTITGNNITNVAVSCTTNSYTLSGSVSGLTGSGLTLTDKNGGTVAVPATGPFTFTLPNAVLSGTSYDVTVATDPVGPPQGCSVADGSGTVQGSAVTGVQVSCNNATQALLVADPQGNVITYLIDPSTGNIATTSTSPTVAGLPATDPTGDFVYAASNENINGYTLSSTNAALVPIAGSPFTITSTGGQIVIDPTGHFLYTASGAGAFGFTRNTTTGALTAVAGSPFAAPTSGLLGTANFPGAVQQFLGLSTAFVYYPIDLTGCLCYELQGFGISSPSGALTSLSFTGPSISINVGSSALSPAGTLLFLANGLITTYSIDATTGALTSLSTATNFPNETTGFALNAAGTFAYDTDGASVYAYAVNDGVLTSAQGSPYSTGNIVDLIIGGSELVAFDQTDSYVYVANRSGNGISAFAADPTTGALTPLTAAPVAVPTTINGPYILVTARIP